MNKRIIKILFTCLISVIIAFSIFSFACESSAKDVYYTVIFNSDGGTRIPAQSVTSGKTATKPDDPTKDGYTFDGWFTEDGEYDFGSAVNGNITLTAKWTENTVDPPPSTTNYTVTFDSDGGSNVPSDTVESGKTVNKPTDPTRDGYRFDGWYKGNTPYDFSAAVTDDITLTAHWTKKSDTPITEYTVTFDSNGGSSVTSAKVESGKTVSKPTDPTRDGYRFDGWYKGNTPYDFSAAVTDDITLTAHWTKKSDTPTTEYTVTFDSNGGSSVTSAKVESGKTVSKPTDPTRDGYRFDGWYKGNAPYDFLTAVTGNITLTAKWTANSITPPPSVTTYYTVTFNSDGGSKVLAQYVEKDKTATEPEAPVRDGYRFTGWYNGASVYDFSAKVTADITLTAHWENADKYCTVTFVTNCASTVTSQELLSGGKAVKPADPANAGKVLEGWYSDSQLSKLYNFDTAVTKDITLYAKWSDDTSVKYYEVTFDTDGGSTVSAQAVESGKKAVEPMSPTKGNLKFEGWYTEAEKINKYNFATPVTGNVTLYAKWKEVNEDVQREWVPTQADFTDSSLPPFTNNKTDKTTTEYTVNGFTFSKGVYFENKDTGLKLEKGDINTQNQPKAISFSLDGSENTISFVAKGASAGTLHLYKIGENGDELINSWICGSDLITISRGELNLEAGNYYIGSTGGSVRLGSLITYEYLEV